MPRTVVVNGMHEEEGAHRLQEDLEALEGVESAETDHEADVVEIEGDPDELELARTIREAGYETPL